MQLKNIIVQTNLVSMSNQIEELPNNVLCEDIYRMFYPLNLIASIFLSSKFNIRGKVITRNGKKYHILVMLVVFTTMSLWASRSIFGDFAKTTGMGQGSIRSLIMSLVFAFYSSGFVVFYITNIRKSHNNVLLILKIQNIHENIDIKNGVDSFIICNWVSIFVVICINGLLFITYYIAHHYFHIIDAFIDVIFVVLDINLVYSIRVIILLKQYLNHWNNNVLNLRGEENDECYDKLFEMYHRILEAYNLYKDIFQMVVFLWSVNALYRSLWYIEVLLGMLEAETKYYNHNDYLFITSVSVVWMMKDILLEMLQSFKCEEFYIAVEDAETTCILRLKNTNSESHKQLYKRVIQMNRTSFDKMSAFGLFYIDAGLALSLTGLITNHTVVLLQFAFL